LAVAMMPIMRWFYRGRSTSGTLSTLRAIFVVFVVSMVLILPIAFATIPSSTADPGWPWLALVLPVVGAVATLVVAVSLDRPLPCDTTLVVSYQKRFFRYVAFSEAPALLGFVGAIVVENPWPYPVGLIFAAAGFAWLAPTRRNLERDQRALDARGCGRDLTAELLPVRL